MRLICAYLTALAVLIGLGTVRAGCGEKSANARELDDVLPSFNKHIRRLFVGQTGAVSTARRELAEFVNAPVAEPLVLHFVGPSGTGKSYLAEIIAKSRFRPVDCKPQNEDLVDKGLSAAGAIAGVKLGSPLGPLGMLGGAAIGALTGFVTGWGTNRALEHTCMDSGDLNHWLQMCGVVRIDFSHMGGGHDDGAFAAEKLAQELELAAEEVLYHPNAVLIFDDFNYCVGPCERMLREFILSHALKTRDGRVVSAKECLIILTSDLHQFGLQLEPGEVYEEALKRVEDAAREYWKRGSVFLSRAVLVPFASLSDHELLKILDMILDLTRDAVRRRVERALRLKEKSDANKIDKLHSVNAMQYKWLGEFQVKEDTKLAMVDRMNSASESANARAITEELRSLIRKQMKFPVPVEDALLSTRAKMSRDGSMYFSCDIELLVVADDEQDSSSWLRFRVTSKSRARATSSSSSRGEL